MVLVRDNIGENIGGSLMDECRARNVKSAFICPRHPQQNYAEGYLGRVTAMASFAMVYSGAPLFMWIFSIHCAVFTGNICASYYPKYSVWATPYELVHNEPFPDASIIVPFGCAALVLRDSDDRPKFHNRCTLMIFVHYADEHPLFTYALYSPRTKRVVHQQDVIFLTSVFPMRQAREGTGLGPDGDKLMVFRSPPSMRKGCDDDLSFGLWSVTDDLPLHDDDVTSFEVDQPYEDLVEDPIAVEGVPVGVPHHPSFPPSGVVVPIRSRPTLTPQIEQDRTKAVSTPETGTQEERVLGEKRAVAGEYPDLPVVELPGYPPRGQVPGSSTTLEIPTGPDSPLSEASVVNDSHAKVPVPVMPSSRRRVQQRWTYEPITPIVSPGPPAPLPKC